VSPCVVSVRRACEPFPNTIRSEDGHARTDRKSRTHRAGRAGGAAEAERCGQADGHPRDDAVSRRAAREPDHGCSICVDIHSRELRIAGEPDERIFLVAAWREAPYYTDSERAALALTEAATRLADRPDAVPDELWEEVSRHYDEQQLAGLVLLIASMNAWNRINAVTRQVSGAWIGGWLAGRSEASEAA